MTEKRILHLVIVAQVFSLLFLILMPVLIGILNDRWGKLLYCILVIGAVGLAMALRHALSDTE
jgi:hypothetical protein